MKNRIFALAVTFTLLPAVAPFLRADTFTEGADAGINEEGAVLLPANTTEVQGTLKAGTLGPFSVDPVDVDVYAFTILEAVPAAQIDATGAFDVNLLLLREGFFGIEGDDDGGGGGNSQITTSLAPGTYYIAIGQNNIAAYPFGATMEGDETWGNDSGFLAGPEASTPIAFIGATLANPTDTNGMAYTVTFSFGGVEVAVTGIDASAGIKKRLLKGAGILNNSGKQQTVTAKGSSSTKFHMKVQSTGDNRTILSRIKGSASRLDFTAIAKMGGRKNVTANLKTKGYKRVVPSGQSLSYLIKVNRGAAPRVAKKFLIQSADLKNKSLRDTAGAKIALQ